MGSKGRMPPPPMRRPPPGLDMIHPDSFGPPGLRSSGGPFPFDMLPPPEVMEQKLAAQHVEMQRLATENQRLAATHSVLRQELAAAQHELERLHAHIGVIKTDKEQQMRALMDKIAKMEVDLLAVEPMKAELQQAGADAQNLVAARKELLAKVHQLNQDLQRSHVETQQIPSLMSELDGLRNEYHHCRDAYDYEKKMYNDHLESLQVMEKNYVSMVREVEKLRAELSNGSSHEKHSGTYGVGTAYKENDVSAFHAAGQNAYGDGYKTLQQPHGPPVAAGSARAGYDPAAPAHALYDPAVPSRAGYDPSSPYTVAPAPAAAPSHAGYDVQRGPRPQAPEAPGSGGPSYGGSQAPPARGRGYDVPRGGNPNRR